MAENESQKEFIDVIPKKKILSARLEMKKKVFFNLRNSSFEISLPFKNNQELNDSNASSSNPIGNITTGKLTQFFLSKENPFNEDYKNKVRKLDFIHTQYTYNTLIQASLAIASAFACILEYEHTVKEVPDSNHEYYHTHFFDEELIEHYGLDENYFENCRNCAFISSCLSFSISILLWITIFFDMVLKNQVIEHSLEKNWYEAFFGSSSNLIKGILLLIMCIPAPMPFTFGVDFHAYNDDLHAEYNIPLNSIFTAVALFRLFFVFKYYLVSSKAYSQRANRFCRINNVKFHLSFPFKANMAHSPMTVNSQLFIIFIFICSYNVRIFERYLDFYTGQNFGNFLNDLWYIFITMTTVGYGDLYTKTLFGRFFSIFGCLIGVFIISLSVVCFSNVLDIRGSEDNIFTVIEKSDLIDEKNYYSEHMLYDFMIEKKLNEIRHKDKSYRKNCDEVVRSYTKKIRKVSEMYHHHYSKRKFNNSNRVNSPFRNIMEYLGFLEDSVKKTREDLDNVVKNLDAVLKEAQTKIKNFE